MKILLADDHAIVREGLKQILTKLTNLEDIEAVQDGFAAVDAVRKNSYDVIILDLSMPGKTGVEALKEIKQIDPSIPVLILSIHPEKQFAFRALKNGASGYMMKDSAPDELVNAVRKVSNGGKYISASLAESLADAFTAKTEKPHESLSDREFQVLRLISSGHSVSMIADELHISVKTVSTYRTRLLEKMGLSNNAELTRYAMENGLI